MPDSPRKSKRVKWQPDSAKEQDALEPRFDIEADRVSREDSNDDRLKSDKPPHWG
jgi:hypothetical protein